MDEVVFLYTTWPDAETAEAAGRKAVERGLAACVNIWAPMVSVYRWDGAVERSLETPMTIKTTATRAEALKALILELHPYELPCIVGLQVDPVASHSAFLHWVRDATR